MFHQHTQRRGVVCWVGCAYLRWGRFWPANAVRVNPVIEDVKFREDMLAMNEALLLGSLRQHELSEAGDSLNARLREEIIERKVAEALLSCQKQALEMIAKGEPLEPVLDFLARSMESQSQDEFLVALHLLEEDGHHFGHVAAPSLPASYAKATTGMDARLQMGPCSAAVIAQKPTIVRDFAAETRWPAFAAGVVSLGLRGCFTAPIVSSDRRILGTFAIYYRQPRDPSPSDRQLVEIVTRTVSIAIERKQAENKLRQSEAFSQSVFESNSDCVKILDVDGGIERMNVNGQCLMEIDDFGAICGKHWPSLWPQESHAQIEAAMAEALAGRTGRFSGFCPTAKGTPRWWDVIVTAIPSADGQPARMVAASRDVTERKQAEQRQLLLTNELAHRGNNLLAVIQTIASRTLAGARPLAETRDVFLQRIQALARSQSVLLTEGFEGAPLTEIVRLEFEGFSDRVKAVGPHVMLNPRVAQTFALLVHELATNATKHGALSRPSGVVAIDWSIEGAGAETMFKFRWQESAGPPVVPPTRQGFGRILLEKAVAQEFGAPPTIEFAPQGLSYEIIAPLSAVAAAGSVGVAA